MAFSVGVTVALDVVLSDVVGLGSSACPHPMTDTATTAVVIDQAATRRNACARTLFMREVFSFDVRFEFDRRFSLSCCGERRAARSVPAGP